MITVNDPNNPPMPFSITLGIVSMGKSSIKPAMIEVIKNAKNGLSFAQATSKTRIKIAIATETMATGVSRYCYIYNENVFLTLK
jgi:hypothetical protein